MPPFLQVASPLRAAVFAALCCCAPLTAWGQHTPSALFTSTDQQGRLFATTDLVKGKPYLPSDLRGMELPVALGGFSAVALRDHQAWLPGTQKNQLVFDGQIYWFAGDRDRDIFAAAPQKYAPVLGGDCVVTFVNTGERTMGKLEYGMVHARRNYFFASSDEREQFRKDPSRYADGDLALGGKCIVSRVNQDREVIGLPETVAIVNGLRYHFAGAYERKLFAGQMAHFGVRRELLHAEEDRPVHSLKPKVAVARPKIRKKRANQHEGATPLPKRTKEQAEDHIYVMEGYCPVSIREKAVWTRGSYRNLVRHHGRKYLLSGEEEKQMFLDHPERYVPVLGGDCIVSLVDEGKMLPGGVYHSVIVEGKLYLFAGPEQERIFKANPTKYVESVAAEEEPAEDEPSTGEKSLSETQNG